MSPVSNPVRAKLVKKPQEYRWSSARAHIAGQDDRLVHVAPLLEMFGKWDDFLSKGLSDGEVDEFRYRERTGRPLGADSSIARLETVLGRILRGRNLGQRGLKRKMGISKIKYDVPRIWEWAIEEIIRYF